MAASDTGPDRDGIELVADMYTAAAEADGVVILTEWDEFSAPDLPRLARLMRRTTVVDARNLLDPELRRTSGFTYDSIGWR